MRIEKGLEYADKEVLDINFINKFTRSQIESEIKRQERIFPILLKPQDNAFKLSDEEEELKHQLELNPNLFKLPNIIYDNNVIKNNFQTRTSSPKVIVQAPAFIDTSRNGQKIQNIKSFQLEPHIYQKNVTIENLSNTLQDLNLSNSQEKFSNDDDWEPELLDLNDTGLSTDLFKERHLLSDLVYQTAEKIYNNSKRIKVKNNETNSPDFEKYLRKITIGTSNSNKKPIKAVRELLKDIQHFSRLNGKDPNKKVEEKTLSRDSIKENLKNYLLYTSNRNKREKSNRRRRDPSYKKRSQCRCETCNKKISSRKSKSREPINYKRQYNENSKRSIPASYPLKYNILQKTAPVFENYPVNIFDPNRAHWIPFNNVDLNKQVLDNHVSFNIRYHENFRKLTT